jgi:L-ascorbate metabolism protein UlaG (beta-lactamase superfamily)
MPQTSSDSTGIEIRWFPPSWLLIRAVNKVIYIDPAWIQNNFESYSPRVIFSQAPDPMDGLPEADLPKADIILITHHHQDHVKTATLNRLASARTAIIAPPKCADLIARKFHPIEPGEEMDRGGVHIKAVYAYNTPEGRSTNKLHHRGECVGYLLTLAGRTVYHAGDTDFIPEMCELGKVDVAFLPIGGTYTMDADEAVQAARAIKPRRLVPIHHLHTSPQAFAQKAASIPGVKVEVLGTGGSLRIRGK